MCIALEVFIMLVIYVAFSKNFHEFNEELITYTMGSVNCEKPTGHANWSSYIYGFMHAIWQSIGIPFNWGSQPKKSNPTWQRRRYALSSFSLEMVRYGELYA